MPDLNHNTSEEATFASLDNSQTAYKQPQAFLAGGGEMGERMRATDWSKTELGPAENWPQSLKTAVRIVLTSRQPMFVWWGKNLINLYNDAYKAIVGGKHPQALGQPAYDVWREIWEQVSARVEVVTQQNEGTYDEALLLIMERYGYSEETYYTFSYSPVPGDNGGTEGIICANTDDTQRIIGERQLKLLSELAAGTADARTIEDACKLSANHLGHNRYDIPFAMIYLVDQAEQTVKLAGLNGIEKAHPAVPHTASLHSTTPWPFDEVITENKICLVDNLDLLFDDLPTGAWERPPHQAAVVPIPRSGQTGKSGILIVGLNPFRLFDEGYSGFINLIVGQIGACIANAQAYEEERNRAEALAEIDRAKTTFFSNVSHEFRTPLTLMLGPIEDMLNEAGSALSPGHRQNMETLHRNSLRLLKLVNTLLDFSRIEADRMQATYEPTDLASFTAELASAFRSAIEQAGMQLVVNCPPLGEPVYVDHDMWEKIVLNLLSNAFKYTLQGKITVTLQKIDGRVELKVQDSGNGIAEAEIAHIFERFHRIQGAKGRTYEGTGIGLALVQELVRLHGGAISVESVVDLGSTFTVAIPLGTKHLAKERISARRTQSSSALGANLFVEEALRWLPDHGDTGDIISDLPVEFAGVAQPERPLTADEAGAKARILLADDNADMREYVTRLLSQRYEVTAVANGKLALESALENPPDLVLTDVMMPQLDGFGLLKGLRDKLSTSPIPVIMLSARAGEEASIEGMEAGADDYLVKPFSARELIARVGAHLEMARVRKEAAEKIREVQERLSTVVNNSPVVLWSIDKNGIYTLSEGMGLEPLGIKAGELVGQSHFEMFKDYPELTDPAKRALGGESFVAAYQFQGRWFDTNYSPSHDEAGQITGVVAVSTDVSERKKAEEERERILRQFEAVLDQMPAGVLIAQPGKGELILSNKQVEKIFRQRALPANSLIQDGKYQGVHADGTLYQMEDWPLLRALTKGEVVVDEEINILRGDGTSGTISVSAAPIRDQAGNITAAVVIFIDITERKHLENQKDEFIGIASHELKTPVTSLKAYGQVLQTMFKRKGDTKAVEQLGKMDTQINKLTGLIRDLLDVTKLQAGKLQFQEELFDFNELINEIVEELQRTTDNHTILKELSPTGTVYGDRERTGQVVTNLISNAIKYSPYADKIIVRSLSDPNQLTLSVQDFGIGIAQDKQSQIFERFYRVGGDRKETFPGLGLGLYISSQIIARQGGRIWVESVPEEGSIFYFSLPVRTALSAKAETPANVENPIHD